MMSGISQRLNENALAVEAQLAKLLEGSGYTYQKLLDSMNYSISAGGKRVRPTLVLEFAKLFGGTEEQAMPYACAIEMIHTYSLIHDDLPCMDNDDMRRGKPTNHRQFGEATALLAGDALLTMAFGITASNPNVTPERNMQAVKILSENAGVYGMCGGQMIDLTGEGRKLTYGELIEMNTLKTGALMMASAHLGCAAAGAYGDSEKRTAAGEYARNIGLSFQVIDDLLDEGTEDGKTTFLTFMSDDEARSYAAELTQNAIDAVKGYEGSEFLCGFAEMLLKRNV